MVLAEDSRNSIFWHVSIHTGGKKYISFLLNARFDISLNRIDTVLPGVIDTVYWIESKIFRNLPGHTYDQSIKNKSRRYFSNINSTPSFQLKPFQSKWCWSFKSFFFIIHDKQLFIYFFYIGIMWLLLYSINTLQSSSDKAKLNITSHYIPGI